MVIKKQRQVSFFLSFYLFRKHAHLKGFISSKSFDRFLCKKESGLLVLPRLIISVTYSTAGTL